MAALVAMPKLEDSAVVLRGFRESDATMVAAASRDPLIPQITTLPDAATPAAVLAWIERQHRRHSDGIGFSFCIAAADGDRPLGQVGLWVDRPGGGRASIGYWIAPEERGAGLATRALRLVSSWGIRHPGVDRLELYVEPWNEGSWRAAERVGFQREGLLRRWQHVGDQRRDMYMYSLLPDDLQRGKRQNSEKRPVP